MQIYENSKLKQSFEISLVKYFSFNIPLLIQLVRNLSSENRLPDALSIQLIV